MVRRGRVNGRPRNSGFDTPLNPRYSPRLTGRAGSSMDARRTACLPGETNVPTYRHWPEPAAAGGAPTPRRVLIVDESSETREVLRAALERRGMEILEAPEVGRGLDLARRFHPDVIVLDADAADIGDDSQRQACTSACARERSSLVVLGQWPDAPRAEARSDDSNAAPPLRVVRKPFHFEPLVRLIADLSQRRRAA